MRTSIVFLFIIIFSCQLSAGPPSFFIGKIAGTVTDAATGETLPGVNILIPALKRGTSTDVDGRFSIERLREGRYTLTFSYLGYARETRTVMLDDKDVEISVQLHPSVLSFPTVTVTSTPQARELLLSTQSTSIIDETELTRNRAQTLTETINHLPGVHGLSTGVSIAKPVIRGLAGHRVLVMKDGIRQEGQQWGDEHAPEIDVFHVERVEVVRGPGSLLYGSDALGGVINVITPHVPFSPEGSRSLRSNLALNYFSNNRQLSGSANIMGSEGGLGYQANLTKRDAGDYRAATGVVSNTAFRELNGGAALGFHAENWYLEGGLNRFGSTLDIFEPHNGNDNHGESHHQEIAHLSGNLKGSVVLEGVRVEGHIGAQKNTRMEFEADGVDSHGHDGEAAIELITDTYEVDLKAHHRPFGKLSGTIGLSYLQQNVISKGEDKLVPDSDMNDFALLVFEEYLLDRVTLSGGMRYDVRFLKTRDNGSFPGLDAEHTFRALSVSVGFSWLVLPEVSAIFSVARGWRAPIPFELYADGSHHGTSTYYIGRSDLQPEVSTSHDLALRYSSAKVKAELAGYVNLVDQYMYAASTGLHDTQTGYPIRQYRSARRAQIHGLEFSLQSELLPWLTGEISADVTIGKNLDLSQALPLIPPPRIVIGMTAVGGTFLNFTRPYVGFRLNRVFPQDRIGVGEEPSGGYNLVDLNAGANLPMGSSEISISLTLENAFNLRYTDHLSRLKPFGIANPGRNIVARMNLPISIRD